MLTALPKRKELKVNSSRAQHVKTLAHELADFLCQPDPEVQTKLQLFSKELYSTLESTVNIAAALHKAREQMWI